MSGRGSDPNNRKIQGLVLFKKQIEELDNTLDDYSLESVDQEDKIKLLSEMAPFGSEYRYSIIVANQSIAPITDIKIRVKYPNFLHLARISPPVVSIKAHDDFDKILTQITIELDELDGNTKKQLNFYFCPITLNVEGEIATYITFVNNKDFVRVLNSDPINIVIKQITIEPKIIPSYQVGSFLQKEGIKKAIKSLGVGIENDRNFGLYFNHIEQIIRAHNFQLIAKDEVKRIAWFFGTELESKEEILIIGQIVNNKVEILATSNKHHILISLLTKISKDLINRIISAKHISSEEEIYELECKYCGAVLPYFPIKGETITCKICNSEQMVW
ncbi:MAG: hypothetical protein ACTSR8_05635 [Promethearchaeota archaeon]